ncbi:sigma-54-dependent transcriptional regulator [Acanthopleuribacter pedis]|uniref:Sigma-54-dependent Fis family transcriptional regulator n=1 Tax=Acanthopleuribacter pedis TaxID=442870 RepID=A0A8J7Q5S7_9BACT|nr:sigma-54 dependent transcriptional regulator [Acanthopleuribacter pedis]MBO1317220.1 sigma-54-dependent Fis family transcriptional regulator [Acanthopleuribacter pedis]MBO1318526.1 sigma-54-dependent Fis family transcriptional regulator [Acanthopleuribacter pedis]
MVFRKQLPSKSDARKAAPAKKYRILVVDDEPAIADQLASYLAAHFSVTKATSGNEALALIRREMEGRPNPFQVIITDQAMPDMSGVAFLMETQRMLPDAKRIILTAYSDIDAVINAINKANVFRFLMKPWEPAKLLEAVHSSLRVYESERENRGEFREIIGRHPKLRSCLDMVSQVAASRAPVLVRGETGTGKELIARAVCQASDRRSKPFTVLHCGALNENVLEAELFGHRRGAFTGAVNDRKGRLAAAHGGTLFIDEVGEIPLNVQAKLLRFLQFGEIQRVGCDRVETVDVRIVAATHRDLAAMVREGSFREDLYFRLKVVEVNLPSLRERRDDLPLLIDYFMKRFWQRPTRAVIHPATMLILENYSFPGNIRELSHIVERACLLAKTEEIGPDLLPAEVLESYRDNELPDADSLDPEPILATFRRLSNEELKSHRQSACRKCSEDVERRFLRALMTEYREIAEAAKAAGMHRTYLHRLLTKHKLRGCMVEPMPV